MNFTKNFEKARGLVKACLFAAVILCIVGLLINGSLPDFGMFAVIGALVLMAIALFVVFTCLKCPYCGKQIFMKCLTVTSCPHCRRNLTTGLKGKKKR